MNRTEDADFDDMYAAVLMVFMQVGEDGSAGD